MKKPPTKNDVNALVMALMLESEKKYENLIRRLKTKVVRTERGCLEYQGHRSHGYGRIKISVDGRPIQLPAHRVAYAVFRGLITIEETAHHICENPPCINAGQLGGDSHIEPKTMLANIMASDTPARRNREKTHCLRGHELVGENLRVRSGKRECMVCTRARLRGLWRGLKGDAAVGYGLAHPDRQWNYKTECPRGHPYNEENTIWDNSKSTLVRKCRECYLKRQMRWRLGLKHGKILTDALRIIDAAKT